MEKRKGSDLLQRLLVFRETKKLYTRKERRKILKCFRKELSEKIDVLFGEGFRKKTEILKQFALYKEHKEEYTDEEREAIEDG